MIKICVRQYVVSSFHCKATCCMNTKYISIVKQYVVSFDVSCNATTMQRGLLHSFVIFYMLPVCYLHITNMLPSPVQLTSHFHVRGGSYANISQFLDTLCMMVPYNLAVYEVCVSENMVVDIYVNSCDFGASLSNSTQIPTSLDKYY